jgi:hypothetical protein
LDSQLHFFLASSFDDANLIRSETIDPSLPPALILHSNYPYSSSSSVPILHMDTPMIDDFISLDADGSEDYGNGPIQSTNSTSEPLRKMFSFDTLAHSVSQPTDASLVIRSNSLERLVDVDMPPPLPPSRSSLTTTTTATMTPAERKRSIPESQEGAALTRKATFDSTTFPYGVEVEGKEATMNGLKKRKLENDSSGLSASSSRGPTPISSSCCRSGDGKGDSATSLVSQSYSSPLVRLSAIEYPPTVNQNQEVADFFSPSPLTSARFP